MSAARGWPGSSPSGRLFTMTVMPCSASPATSCGAIWPLTKVRSSSWRIIAPLFHACVRTTSQAVIIEVRLNVRIVTGPILVHLRKVLRVATREDHVAEALTVGAGQAAVRPEPVEGVLSEHPRPRVSVVARRIAVGPDMQEVARAVAGRHVLGVEAALRQRLGFEFV